MKERRRGVENGGKPLTVPNAVFNKLEYDRAAALRAKSIGMLCGCGDLTS